LAGGQTAGCLCRHGDLYSTNDRVMVRLH
jgi:hypothetical protein